MRAFIPPHILTYKRITAYNIKIIMEKFEFWLFLIVAVIIISWGFHFVYAS